MFNKIENNTHLVFLENKQFLGTIFIFCLMLIGGNSHLFAQTINPATYFTQNQQSQNYMANSTAFRQEIAKMEINVVREGKLPIPISQVPRLQKGDVLKVKMLDETVNGAKPDQSNWDWTFLVAFINPGRNNDKKEAVSEEIQFRRTGWYKEYSFETPYDSQPIFFLYPKPKYRDKIMKLVSKKYDEVRKIGDRTIELAGAYAQIGGFLNELQGVLNQANYGSYGGYQNSIYGNYGSLGVEQGYNYKQFAEQSVERLARSFNIQLPGCWQGNSYGNYGNSGGYGVGYSSGIGQDFVGRIQCVAKNVRLEDFDFSVNKLLQQGGILAVQQLQQRFPQIAQWIAVAAVALDFIVKIAKKTPLKIVPTVIATSGNQNSGYDYQSSYYGNSFAPNTSANSNQPDSVKISLYAENQPNSNDFVTAYPIVLHKWQAEPDPEIITLPAPALMESCLHPGQNILRNTDLLGDWMSDSYAKEFKLLISSPNGFRKEFPLKKNMGMNGWELNLTKEDINSFPKIQLALESEVIGKRGFNEIRSPKFSVPIPIGGSWEVTKESRNNFAVGGRRIVTLRNDLGNCKCLQTVVYKPSFGGEFVFDANGKDNALEYSEDGKEVSFEVDATYFQAGTGVFELRQSGNEVMNLNVNLHPLPPTITNLKISKGDKQAVIVGERLEQVKFVMINGKKAIVEGNNIFQNTNNLPTNLKTISERTVVFEDPNARQDSNNITLEIGLDENRIIPVREKFTFTSARPSIAANPAKEVSGLIFDPKVLTKKPPIFNLLQIFPIDTTGVIVNLENALTDYDFKTGNISIETRIENTELNSNELPKPKFEVLDWKNLKISFPISSELQQYLGGKRLQFRIRDKERGDSDWITVNKTFVRTPTIKSFNCVVAKKGFCQLKGIGIEYISEISVDGGKVWYPQSPNTWSVMPTADGFQEAMVPKVPNPNLIRFKLRDLPKTQGLTFKNLGF